MTTKELTMAGAISSGDYDAEMPEILDAVLARYTVLGLDLPTHPKIFRDIFQGGAHKPAPMPTTAKDEGEVSASNARPGKKYRIKQSEWIRPSHLCGCEGVAEKINRKTLTMKMLNGQWAGNKARIRFSSLVEA